VRGAKLTPGEVAKARRLRRSQTDAEAKLWGMVRDRRLEGAKFVRQYPIGPYVADFVCRSAMLAVELDGGQHSESQADEKRTAFLAARGYRMLRFWNNDIFDDPEGCWDRLTQVLAQIEYSNSNEDD